MGTDWLHEFIENTEEFVNETDDNMKDALKKESGETFMACAFLRNCDSHKCGSLKKNFQTQCALNNNQCPKKISAVSDVLGSHQWDPAHEERKKKKKQQKQENRHNNDKNKNNNDSNNENENGTQLAQNHVTCHCCGERWIDTMTDNRTWDITHSHVHW